MASDHSSIAVAIIAAIPATIAAIAAWRQTVRLKKPVDAINNAVNHRKPGEKRLVELVEHIATELVEVRAESAVTTKRMESLSRALRRHQAWHQERHEEAEDGE